MLLGEIEMRSQHRDILLAVIDWEIGCITRNGLLYRGDIHRKLAFSMRMNFNRDKIEE